jgi:hypothetical protein
MATFYLTPLRAQISFVARLTSLLIVYEPDEQSNYDQNDHEIKESPGSSIGDLRVAAELQTSDD